MHKERYASGLGWILAVAASLAAATSVLALPPSTLQIENVGQGTGSVEVDPLGLVCVPPCTVSVPAGTAVTLSGLADPGSQFWGFLGEGGCACGSCTFTPAGDLTLSSAFGLREGLRVSHGLPACGDTGVAISSTVEIFFSEAIVAGAGLAAIELLDDFGQPVPFHPVIRSTDRRLTLIPDAPFAQGTTYSAQVPADAVEALVGGGLSAPYFSRFTTAQPGAPKMYLAAYPIRLMEGQRSRVSVWFETPVDHDREVTLSGTPSGELLDLFPITVPAGQVLGEAWIDTRINHSSYSDVTATLQATEPSTGTMSRSIVINNYTGTSGIPLTFLAGSVSNDTDGDGIFESGENADVLVEVANFGSSSITNVVLTLRVLNATNLKILGGSPFQCTIGTMPANAVRTCTRTVQARPQLPTGDYYLEVVGTSSSPTMIDQFPVHVVNNSLPDLSLSAGSITSNPLPPGTVVNYRITARNDDDGFVYPPASPPLFQVELEVEGQRTVLYDRVHANVRGDVFPSQDFILPIVYPTTLGTHAIHARIDPGGLIVESNESNNDAEVRFITVAAPNFPPSFDPIAGPWQLVAGAQSCFLVSAEDPNDDPLTFSLVSPPSGATISAASTSSALFCWTPTETQGPASYPITLSVRDNRSPSLSDSTSVEAEVSLMSDLAVAVTDGLSEAVPGQDLSYTLGIQNLGPHAVTDASILDAFPLGLQGVTWTCTAAGGAACGSSSGVGDLAEPVSLPVGGSLTFVASGTIAPQATGTLTNQASAAVPGGWVDAVPDNNQAQDATSLRGLDWGDAPDSTVAGTWAFPVRLEEAGARHGIVPGFHLGAAIDAEPDGQPGVAATGDDSAGLDDEDGVTWPPELVVCDFEIVGVSASMAGRLDAWIDWDGDGNWTGSGEQVFANQTLTPGANALLVGVPCALPPGPPRVARFRLSNAGGLGAEGLALDGEVEDYRVPVAHVADFAVTKDNGQDVARPGQLTTYTIEVINQGPTDAEATITDLFPAELLACSWTCTTSSGASCTAGPVSGHIQDLAVLPGGATATYLATCTYGPTTGVAGVTNTASLAVSLPAIDPDPTNNSATDTDEPEFLFSDGFESGDTSAWSSIVSGEFERHRLTPGRTLVRTLSYEQLERWLELGHAATWAEGRTRAGEVVFRVEVRRGPGQSFELRLRSARTREPAAGWVRVTGSVALRISEEEGTESLSWVACLVSREGDQALAETAIAVAGDFVEVWVRAER